MTNRFGGKLSATRAGCLWIKQCEGSEGRNFLYLCKHGSERGYRKQCKKRKGRPSFTTRELTIITEKVEKNKGILQSKFTDNVTNKTKTETWKAITEKVNAVGVANRTIYEVRQKWKGLFSKAKKEFSQQKKGRKGRRVVDRHRCRSLKRVVERFILNLFIIFSLAMTFTYFLRDFLCLAFF